ncbi:MAG: hypothetical protein U5R49_15505 [Deltaproteobacteria bacterium]|nr:hypothetical protein [Deltaproteobacteria bacterium]
MKIALIGMMALLVAVLPVRALDSGPSVHLAYAAQASEYQSDVDQQNPKETAGVETEQNGQTNHAGASEQGDKKETSKTPPKEGPAVTDGLKKTPVPDKGVSEIPGSAEEDRPWIIKLRKSKKPDTVKKPLKPPKWKSDAQRVQCHTYLTELKDGLNKARKSSIRGDSCATAKHARDFLKKADRCNKECPDKFLKTNGYSEKIIRNVEVLLELGKKDCLGDDVP